MCIFIINDKLKLLCHDWVFCSFSSSFPALSILSQLLQGLMLLLISLVFVFVFSIRSKFFQFIYMHFICKIVKFTLKFSLRWFSELRTIMWVEGSFLVTFLGVRSFQSSSVRKLSSNSCSKDLMVLLALPFFVNDLIFILILRRFITPIKMAGRCQSIRIVILRMFKLNIKVLILILSVIWSVI